MSWKPAAEAEPPQLLRVNNRTASFKLNECAAEATSPAAFLYRAEAALPQP
jgi:hypothetical protein